MIRFCGAALLMVLALVAPAQAERDRMAIGLAALADWGSQQPFLDVMKTARPWIGHRPGQWGGMDFSEMDANGDLDPYGWPLRIPKGARSLETFVLTDLPENAAGLSGRYVLRFDGTGIVEVSGRAQNVRYGDNEVRFDFTPGPGPVEIRIQRTDPARRGDHVRDITVIRADHLEAYDRGGQFNPIWLERIAAFGTLRFMDWMKTNNSVQSDWAKRPKPGDFSYAWRGVPAETVADLGNALKANIWVNIPHQATDAYSRELATLLRNRLDNGLTTYAEYSNEVWNWQFEQTHWADAQAQDRWSARDAGMQFYGMKAAQHAEIWSQVYGADPRASLINVISSQTGWPGLEELVLDAPLWMREQGAGAKRPAEFFDAYAVTGYFGGIIGTADGSEQVRRWITESLVAAQAQAQDQGLTGAAFDAYVQDNRYTLASAKAGALLMDGGPDSVEDLLNRTLPHHVAVARREGLELVMYEGGTHVVGLGGLVEDTELTRFFTHLNYTPEMGRLYDRLLDGWRALDAGVFNAYVDVYVPSRWGSWGALRHLGDDNPRWQALMRAAQGTGQ